MIRACQAVSWLLTCVPTVPSNQNILPPGIYLAKFLFPLNICASLPFSVRVLLITQFKIAACLLISLPLLTPWHSDPSYPDLLLLFFVEFLIENTINVLSHIFCCASSLLDCKLMKAGITFALFSDRYQASKRVSTT